MIEGIRAEWTKLRTLASTAWLLMAAVALTAGASAAIAAVTHQSSPGGDPTRLALSGIDLGQAVVVVLAVLAISDEYGSGMISVTLTTMPHRLVLLAAKAINVVGLVLVAGVLAVSGSLLAGRLMLPGAGFDAADGYTLLSVSHGSTLRASVGSVIYLLLVGLVALGGGAAIRETSVSIGFVLGLLYLPPLLAQVVSDPLRRHIQQVAPMTAGLAIQSTANLRSLPIAPWPGLGVLAVWAAASLVTGGLVLRLR